MTSFHQHIFKLPCILFASVFVYSHKILLFISFYRSRIRCVRSFKMHLYSKDVKIINVSFSFEFFFLLQKNRFVVELLQKTILFLLRLQYMKIKSNEMFTEFHVALQLSWKNDFSGIFCVFLSFG